MLICNHIQCVPVSMENVMMVSTGTDRANVTRDMQAICVIKVRFINHIMCFDALLKQK